MTEKTAVGKTAKAEDAGTTRVRVAREDDPEPAPQDGPAEDVGAEDVGAEDVGAEAAAPGILAQAEETLESWAGQLLPRSWGGRARRAPATIYVDEYRDGGDWVVEAELPGVDPDRDVTLHLDRHQLRLQADRASAAAQRAASDRRELRAGRMVRTLPVPRGVDPGRASAVYRDGIVTIRVPLAPEDEEVPRELTVTRG
ncbi:MAG TPA: Hsp20/alpha crystallin family protein [Actinomycetospora sp.]|uniref:Hsp20/alpha crystallin family protein n=1 Tax=Actinomycetospora sp. TaxID=1872135 RepID=UPI002F422721